MRTISSMTPNSIQRDILNLLRREEDMQGVEDALLDELFAACGESPEAIRGFLIGLSYAQGVTKDSIHVGLTPEQLATAIASLFYRATLRPEVEAAQQILEGSHVRSFDP